MKRITLLMSAATLALAGCSGGGEGTNDVAANDANENPSASPMPDDRNNHFAGEAVTEAAAPNAPTPIPATDTPAPNARADAPKPAPKAAPEAAPKAAPTEEPEIVPKAEPKAPDASPTCSPEHRALGHC